jgi:type I restriction enzyme S subunit
MKRSRNLSGCQVLHEHSVPVDWECIPCKGRVELRYGKPLREEERKQGEVNVFGSNGPVGVHNEHLLPGPGILVGRKGSIGTVHYAKGPFWPIDTVYYVHAAAGDNLRYLYHLLKFLPLAKLNAATGIPGLSRRDVNALRGVFPPLAEQEVIARVLDAADDAIEQTQSAVKQAEVLGTSLLYALLTSAGEQLQKAGKTPTRLDAVATVESGVTLGKDVTGFKSVTRPYLRVANVQDGHLNLDVVKQVTVRLSEVEKFELQPGDVLMTEGGDYDKLGRGAMWEGQISGCLHQNHVFRIRADRSKLDPRYFACVVESNIAKAYFNRVAKRTTNLASTNKTQVRALRFPLPDLSEQERIADVLEASKAHGRALRAQLAAQEALKAALLRDLLTGRVRVGAVTPATVAA